MEQRPKSDTIFPVRALCPTTDYARKAIVRYVASGLDVRVFKASDRLRYTFSSIFGYYNPIHQQKALFNYA